MWNGSGREARRRARSMFEWRSLPAPKGAAKHMSQAAPESPLLNRKKAPYYGQKSSLFRAKKLPVMGAKIPCYFFAHETRRTALACQAGPVAAASFAFRGLLTGRLNPRLFNDLKLFSKDSPVFHFPEDKFVLIPGLR